MENTTEELKKRYSEVSEIMRKRGGFRFDEVDDEFFALESELVKRGEIKAQFYSE